MNNDELYIKIESYFPNNLISYFTEKAILNLIEKKQGTEEYYPQYHEIIYNAQPGFELDNKINRNRLKLWQIEYKNW